MAETYGPFDGTPWAQAQWYDFAPTWTASGVVGVPVTSSGTGDLPLTINGLTVSLGVGRAWVRGAGYKNDAAKAFTVTANTNSSLSRRDRIVLRRDLAAKTVTAIRLQGTAASTPVAPSLTQTEGGQWDIPLFSFLVPPNSGTVITSVVDERVWVSPSGGLSVSFMSARPTTGLNIGDRIYAQDRPTVTYAWDGRIWVQEGLMADTSLAPAGSYVTRQEGSAVVTTANGVGGFVLPLYYSFSSPPLWAGMTVGDSQGNPFFIMPLPGNYTGGTLNGTIRGFDNSSPAVGTAYRVTYVAVGYIV